jgi:hypothetical protein
MYRTGIWTCIVVTILDFKLSSCILSFGWFSGAWILCADVSEHSVPSFLLTSLMKMDQRVPKGRHIKFRPWGITQKKEYNNDDDDDTMALTVSSRLPLDSGCEWEWDRRWLYLRLWFELNPTTWRQKLIHYHVTRWKSVSRPGRFDPEERVQEDVWAPKLTGRICRNFTC